MRWWSAIASLTLVSTLFFCNQSFAKENEASDNEDSTELHSLQNMSQQITEMVRSMDRLEPNEEMRDSLRNAVANLFDLRMKLQRERLDSLERQLQMLKEQQNLQEQQRQSLIDARVAEILDNPERIAEFSQTNQTAPTKPKQIHPGDVLAVYIPGVLPFQAPNESSVPPPVNRIGPQLVTGYPIPVSAEGTIPLPLIGEVEVGALTMENARRLIERTYVNKQILRADRATVVLTLIRSSNVKNWNPKADSPPLP